jgi:hypothetical protein
MIHSDHYKNLIQALSRALGDFEKGTAEGKKSDSDIPDPPEKAITIMTVGSMPNDTKKIPKLPIKADKKNTGVIGSGKKGGKGE